ncbi:dihydroneopterin aldolase [Blattabacterium cuenoti]|uniref:dihydroneopterin aldolase n=1 Tax=Blattabacterium cuenoti TaxID=1653831 RepID=UPI00163B69D0|nr:dihydroneopterin aldolase [Blattabacterium cuenoti]
MGKIILNKIKLFGHHGCIPEEKFIGNNYLINLEIEVDFSNAYINDELSSTIDYVHLYSIVKEEMKIRSKLMEHLAKRIITKLKIFKKLKYAKIKICKKNPPLKGIIEEVCVVLEE